MLFNSFTFIFLFLPIVLSGFFILGRINQNWASAWLVLASLFFYGFWNIKVLPLLLFLVFTNYWIGSKISFFGNRDRLQSTRFLILGLVVDLGILFFFKYSNFLIENYNVFAKYIHYQEISYLKIVLPIGISFYTFTQIAYLVDCYQIKVRERTWLHYTLFVSYFPHLIAGPILHHGQIIPQFRLASTYRLDLQKVVFGIVLFTIGLGKKLLIADHLAPYSDLLFQNVNRGLSPQLFLSWTGVLAYTYQIYFDFSGYTDMAIGISLFFGITLPANFNSPYKASNIIEFWRRWHMTLSAFLKDYLYIPLGGNRHGTLRRYANLLLTMVLGGLWHGASWTFVLWGLLHGLFLSVNHFWQSVTKKKVSDTLVLRTLSWLLTMLCICFSWALFRSDNLSSAKAITRGMLGLNGISLPIVLEGKISSSPDFSFDGLWQGAWHPYGINPQEYLLILGVAIAICLFFNNSGSFIPKFEYENREEAVEINPVFAICLGGVFTLCLFSLNRFSQFLYFQF